MQFHFSFRGLSRLSLGLLASTSFILPLMFASPQPGRCDDESAQNMQASTNSESRSTSTTTVSGGAKDNLNWQADFDKAMQEAKAQQKFVMVDVYTDWCGYCKKLDSEVYTDPAISKYLTDNFIVVKANAEDKAQGEAFSYKFDAHGAYPMVLFFDSKKVKEKPVAKIVGYLPPSEFSTALHGVVESKKFKQKKH